MRQEGAAGPAATATRGVTMLLVRPHVTTALSSPVLETIWDNPSDAIFDSVGQVKFSRTKSGLPLLIPDGWTGTYEQALREATMGKKKRTKQAGKAAAKAKQEKKQPKKRK